MSFFDINNIVFTMGGTGVSLLELVSVISGLLCVVLAGRNSKYNFWVGYIYNILLFILFAQKHLYSAMIMQPIAFSINAFGHWRWTHPREEEKSSLDATALKVTKLSWTERSYIGVFVLVAGLIWGYILSKLGVDWFVDTIQPDPKPYLDSFVLMLIFVAQFLSAQKKWDCWILWLLVNFTNIILYMSAGMVFMPIVSGLYLINGVWSLFTWYKLYVKEKK